MEFIDWRKGPQKTKEDSQKQTDINARKKARMHYVEEQIHNAMERGLFDNLPGYGKPLKLDDNTYAGDKAMGYHLLKNNGYVPSEVQLIKDIRTDREQAEAKIGKVLWRYKTLQARRVAPFPSEKRAFNASVEKAAKEYETALRNINKKILTLNIQTPSVLHQNPLNVEQLVAQFREACPLFENIPQPRTSWYS
jgi:DnaJ family protein C protein 28